MLGMEDLLLANLAVRQGLLAADALRPVLSELDAAAGRVSLPRTLHERGLLRLEDAQALLQAARRRLRQLYEEAFIGQARAQGLGGPGLDAAIQEQAREGYVRPLGDKLVERGLLQRAQHEALGRESQRAFAQHEAQVLEMNRAGGWVQTLGPPAARGPGLSASGRQAPQLAHTASGRHTAAPHDQLAHTASGRHTAAPKDQLAHTASGRHTAAPKDQLAHTASGRHTAAPQGAAPVGTATPPAPLARQGPAASGLRPGLQPPPPPPPPPPPVQGHRGAALVPDDGDAEKTMTLANPASPFAPPGADPSAAFDPGRTMGFLDTIDTPEDPERTISLPAGAGSVLRPPGAPPAESAPDPDRTITLPAGGPSAFGLSASQEENDPFRTIGMKTGTAAGLGEADVTTNVPPPAARAGAVPSAIHGRYQVLRELGRGNMGVVYLARDPQRDELVAVKLVMGPQNDEARGRFKREILVSKRLQHENVIAVFDAGEQQDGSSYMVMEYLEGRSLRDLIKEGPLPQARCLDLAEQLLSGLAAVHGSGIVHRDIKPDNVQVLDRHGVDLVKLMDFGISRFLDSDLAEQEQVFVTMRGTLSGTPAYVAPEAVLEPEVVKQSHDIYAFGVLLYEMLTGQLPFPPSRNLRDLLADTLHAKPRPLEEAYPAGGPWPEPLKELVAKLLEKEPEARPQAAAQALELFVRTRRRIEGKDEPTQDDKGKSGKKARPAGQRKEPITTRIARAITGLFKRKKV